MFKFVYFDFHSLLLFFLLCVRMKDEIGGSEGEEKLGEVGEGKEDDCNILHKKFYIKNN